MKFTRTQNGDFLVIEAIGRLDVTNAAVFEKEISNCISEGHDQLVVDMKGSEYISSAGLRAILVSAKAVKAKKGEMRFAGLSGMVEEIFTISGFKSMFKIYDTVAAATSE